MLLQSFDQALLDTVSEFYGIHYATFSLNPNTGITLVLYDRLLL